MKLLKGAACISLLGVLAFLVPGCSDDRSVAPDVSRVDNPGSLSPEKNLAPQDPGGDSHVFPTFVVTFDEPEIEGNWSFYGNADVSREIIETAGGNPGAFLHSPCDGLACLDTYAPQFRTQLGRTSRFTGNYRARGVRTLGVDLAVYGPEILTTLGRPLSLILSHDPGTPTDPNDDLQITYVGKHNIPNNNGRFKSYWFDIPYASETLPEDWVVRLGRGSGDHDADWNLLIQDVTQVTFFFGDPDYYFMFQQWELGADNVILAEDGE